MDLLIYKRCLAPWLILLSLAISLACGALPGLPSSGANSDSVTVKENVSFGSGRFTLSDPATGLADLSSYTATLTISFDGAQNNQVYKWSRKYVMLASKNPSIRQLNIDSAGGASGDESIYMAEMDGTDYEAQGQNGCTASPIQDGQSLSETLEPASLLGFVAGADTAGSDKVNNVAADHYTFNELARGQQNLTQSTGELWVATDGGYVVKYLLSSKAGADYFGSGIEGTMTWDYELTDIGMPVKIKLPADCPPGMVNAPLLPNLSNEVNTPGLLTYQTSTSLADAAAFYQKQIPSLGWIQQGKPDVTAAKAFMDFKQGTEDMTIVITTGSGITDVSIVLYRTQK